jgi:hypothetical protein
MSRADLLALVDQAYDRPSWHGPNLRGSIRGVTSAEAARRPGPGRHNIWELVVHAAYWKYAVVRRLTRAKRGTFELGGSNFIERPKPGRATPAAWRADIAFLDRTHRRLRDVVADVATAALHRPIESGKVTPFYLITGIAAHDIYHAGQIQLLKRLLRAAGRGGS